MSFVDSVLHRILLAVGAIIIAIPGLRLLFGTVGYVDGKDNLSLSADLYSELRAMGSLFVVSGLVLLGGALVAGVRNVATVVGTVAFLPQGIARIVSYSVDEGQHDSYLRAGLVEFVIGIAFAVLLIRGLAGARD